MDLDGKFWGWLPNENFSTQYFRIKLEIGFGRRLPTLEESALDWGGRGRFEQTLGLAKWRL
jgi:hypothetical protein